MLELTVRLVFSLAVVIGLLLLIARFSARRFRSQGGASIQVVHRQALTRTSSVSVVTVGGRVLVLGSTEQQINLLAELDPDELDLAITAEDTEPDVIAPALGLAILDSPRTVPVAQPLPLAQQSRAQQPRTQQPRTQASREQQSPAPATGVRRGAHKAPGARKASRRAGAAARRPATPRSDGPLAGSILSPDTWRQALGAARRAS